LRRLSAALLAATGLLAACATPHPGPVVTPAPKPPPPAPEASVLVPETWAELPGWAEDDHLAALQAFRVGCSVARDLELTIICQAARSAAISDAAMARRFFEQNFHPVRVSGEGVLTAYFAPEYPARQVRDAEFSAPVRPRPADLVISGTGGRDAQKRGPDGTLSSYPDRAAIDAGGTDQALAWMRPEDLFFLQIQGSGVLTFEDGRRMKALFAATNGRPFSGIANPMRDKGLLAADNTSGDAIRSWLAAHRGPEADAVMQINARYVFFSLAPDDGRPPVGAAGIPLPGGRAIAVDASRHSLGELVYIDGAAPILSGAFPSYRRLVMALDVGGAIKGEVRADLYLGQGAAAGAEAGRVRHVLKMHRLIPITGTGK